MLVYDSNEAPAYVYRFEDSRGCGPYNHGRSHEIPEGEDFRDLHRGDPIHRVLHPSPHVDFSFEEGDYALYVCNALFGFFDVESAFKWFNEEERKLLHRHGFRLVRRAASKVWLSNSARQLMFVPWERGDR